MVESSSGPPLLTISGGLGERVDRKRRVLGSSYQVAFITDVLRWPVRASGLNLQIKRYQFVENSSNVRYQKQHSSGWKWAALLRQSVFTLSIYSHPWQCQYISRALKQSGWQLMVMVVPHLTSKESSQAHWHLVFILIKKQLGQSHKILSPAAGKHPDITQVFLALFNQKPE